MANLILPSLEIQNFRAFEHLRIERLGRVNLITGKNNVGKTSLLEALYLYANDGIFRLLRDLLTTRDELYFAVSTANTKQNYNQSADGSGIRHLFYGRPAIVDITEPITIGTPTAEPNRNLSVQIEWFQYFEKNNADEELSTKLVRVPATERISNPEATPYVVIKIGNNPPVRRTLEKLFSSVLVGFDNGTNEYIRSHGLGSYRMSELWDNIALTPLEDDVTEALRIIVPNINRVSMIGEHEDARGPIPIMSIKGHQERSTLRSLGDGVNRLFGIALSLVNVQNGILLIDEVETGLHYSVMPDVWKLIFQVAERLNVQVFATTHSWDCIEAFQQAAAQDQNEEAVLIRLENRNGSITATLFDERKLDIATRELIEVR